MTWPLVPLGELGADVPNACVGGPFGSELTTRDYVDAGVPVIRGTNLGEEGFVDDGFVLVSAAKAEALRQNQAHPGDVVFTQRGTIGQVALIPHSARYPRYVISQSQMKLTPDLRRVEPRYLVHYFRSPRALAHLQSNTLATGVPHINLTILRRMPVPLPTLAEQRRIADVLDRADDIRRKRKKAVTLTEELLRSAFFDRFGDPVANPKGWPVRSITDLCASKQYGTAEKANTEGRGQPVLRMNNLSYGGEIDVTELKWVELPTREREKLDLRDGDVLFNRVNSRELVGKTAVWHNGPGFTFAGYLIRLRMRQDIAGGDYVSYALNMPSIKARLAQMAKPSINMANISGSDLDRLVIPVPPLKAQDEFAEFRRSVSALRERYHAMSSCGGELFYSLVARAFSGGLAC